MYNLCCRPLNHRSITWANMYFMLNFMLYLFACTSNFSFWHLYFHFCAFTFIFWHSYFKLSRARHIFPCLSVSKNIIIGGVYGLLENVKKINNQSYNSAGGTEYCTFICQKCFRKECWVIFVPVSEKPGVPVGFLWRSLVVKVYMK